MGLVPYEAAWREMREFTDARRADTQDQLWLLQHPPVFTLGQAGRPEHLLAAGEVPVVRSDRGGQVTYHGPGQWVAYLLLDIRRRKLGARELVDALERSLVRLLADYGIRSAPRPRAPGVYVDGGKIAALGLRVRRGCTYHGLALNVDMDLEPFARINPCGHAGLRVTSMRECLGGAPARELAAVGEDLVAALQAGLARRTAAPGAALSPVGRGLAAS